jgi:mRNA interferase YafQ
MNKLTLVPTNQFKRDVRKQFQMLVTTEWVEVLYYLINDKELPDKYRDHALA